MSIPVSQTVKVNPGVLAAAGSAIDVNGLILTQSPFVPIGAVSGLSSAAAVGAFFGLTSLEYQAALIYFAGPTGATKTPGLLYFSQYPVAPVSAYLRGGALSLTLAQLNALSGVLTLTVNGTAVTSSAINLASSTSFSAAAALIQSGFTAPAFTVSYDALHNAFAFTTTATGAAATIGFATGTLSAGLNLTAAGSAVTSQGAIASTPAAAMTAVLAVTLNWVTFTTTWEPVLADKASFSGWSSGQGSRFAYVGYDSDANAKVTGSTTTWAAGLAAASYDGTIPVFGNLTHAAFVMSWAGSLDFNRLNGRQTLALKSQSGLVPYVTDGTTAATLTANGYNFYGAYANAKGLFQWFAPGSMPGQWLWADSFINQVWLSAQLQIAMIKLLTSVGSIPYNTQGYAMVDAAVMDPIAAAVNFGAIRTGVALSDAQVAQMRNAIGSDVSQAVTTNGYYLQIAFATAAIRVARTSPPMTLFYADGGSIQQLMLASIEVQ